jgi:Putative adhesin
MSAVALERRRSPGLVALAAVGFILSVAVIAVGALILLEVAARHSFQTTAAYTNVRALVVRTGAGDVSLTEAPAGAPLVVKAVRTESLFKPKVGSYQSADGSLTLSASCHGNLECGVHYELSLPRDATITVSSGFGDIVATGLTSSSSIRLDTTAGDIRVSGLNAPDIRLSTGLGGLTASLQQPAQTLVASTVAGGLNLTVPDTTYVVHANSGVGHVSDQAVRVDARSPRTIDATSSLGNITITTSP